MRDAKSFRGIFATQQSKWNIFVALCGRDIVKRTCWIKGWQNLGHVTFFFLRRNLTNYLLADQFLMPFAFYFNPLKLQISYSQRLSADSSPDGNLSSWVSPGSPLCSPQRRGKAATSTLISIISLCLVAFLAATSPAPRSLLQWTQKPGEGSRLSPWGLQSSCPSTGWNWGGSTEPPTFRKPRAPVAPKWHLPNLQGFLKQRFVCNKAPACRQVAQILVGLLQLEQSVTA